MRAHAHASAHALCAYNSLPQFGQLERHVDLQTAVPAAPPAAVSAPLFRPGLLRSRLRLGLLRCLVLAARLGLRQPVHGHLPLVVGIEGDLSDLGVSETGGGREKEREEMEKRGRGMEHGESNETMETDRGEG